MVLIALLGIALAQAAEPTGTLTLACQGTAIDKTDPTREAARPEPVSMGLMIDLTNKTIAGFERVFPTFSARVVKIILVDDTSIGFSGTDGGGGAVFGQVDRITGDVEAAMEYWSHQTNPAKLQWATLYSLKCKPTQRMF
jgi:hypothetical protein